VIYLAFDGLARRFSGPKGQPAPQPGGVRP
jgi:hypothetical protein